MEGENSKEIKTNDWVGAFGALYSVVNFDSSSGSRMGSEAHLEGSGHGSAKISDSLDAVSSSLSNSSSEELFQFSHQAHPKSIELDEISKPSEGTDQVYNSSKLRVPSVAWHRLDESMSGSPESNSQFTHECFVPHMSPTQFPPAQVMERTGDFDPHRIPESIFSNPSSPTDWSVASNESLFSIKLGNESLPRDHALKMSEDIYQSGELLKSEELYKSGELCLSREFYRSGELFKSEDPFKTSSASEEVEPNDIVDMSKNVSNDMRPGEKTVLIHEPISDVPEACINNQSGINDSSHPSFANHHTAGGEPQIKSFASLIKKKHARPWWHCLYGRLCCCYKWSSCYSTCCSCEWSSCYSTCCSCEWLSFSNCFGWLRCCCKCPSWLSCKCHGSNCSWLCCCCCYSKSKRPHSDSFYTWMEWG